jgi:hypothetical protein
MFNFFKRKTSMPTYVVEQTPDGKFAIVTTDARENMGTYTRKRDAVRGAMRKGITLANA